MPKSGFWTGSLAASWYDFYMGRLSQFIRISLLLFSLIFVITAKADTLSFTKVPQLDRQKLLKQYAIPKKCRIEETKADPSNKVFLISVWCQGVQRAQFIDLNEDGRVERVELFEEIKGQKKEIIYQDTNLDHQFDDILISVMRGGVIETTRIQDTNFDGKKDLETTSQDSVVQESACYVSKSGGTIGLTRDLANYVYGANAWINKNCPSSLGTDIVNGIKTVQACFDRLGTNQAKLYKAKVSQATSLRGTAILFSCDASRISSPDAFAAAFLDNSEIVMRPSYVKTYRKPHIEATIFHEYLHIALGSKHSHAATPPRVNEIDPVIACEACCAHSSVKAGYGNFSNRELMCGFCSGKEKDIRKYQFIMAADGDPGFKEVYQKVAKPRLTDPYVQEYFSRISAKSGARIACKKLKEFFPEASCSSYIK